MLLWKVREPSSAPLSICAVLSGKGGSWGRSRAAFWAAKSLITKTRQKWFSCPMKSLTFQKNISQAEWEWSRCFLKIFVRNKKSTMNGEIFSLNLRLRQTVGDKYAFSNDKLFSLELVRIFFFFFYSWAPALGHWLFIAPSVINIMCFEGVY